ncbi:MAG: hypothetical protein LBG31_05200 [Prevotellaceae bacterium]|jgi:hypothetical protein|nr:hypothetical protein [Prevotellaceae bacterium]
MKDWTGNKKSLSVTLGASNLTGQERAIGDYYATEPKAVRLLLSMEKFEGKIWECACGEGHLSKEIRRLGYEVYSTDIIDRGFGDRVFDFLSLENNKQTAMHILTNPPYRYADEFIRKALSIATTGKKVAFFMPVRYLEGKARKQLFLQAPPKVVYISSSRLKCARNGDFAHLSSSAVAYAWFVWEKAFQGTTTLQWFN